MRASKPYDLGIDSRMGLSRGFPQPACFLLSSLCPGCETDSKTGALWIGSRGFDSATRRKLEVLASKDQSAGWQQRWTPGVSSMLGVRVGTPVFGVLVFGFCRVEHPQFGFRSFLETTRMKVRILVLNTLNNIWWK